MKKNETKQNTKAVEAVVEEAVEAIEASVNKAIEAAEIRENSAPVSPVMIFGEHIRRTSSSALAFENFLRLEDASEKLFEQYKNAYISAARYAEDDVAKLLRKAYDAAASKLAAAAEDLILCGVRHSEYTIEKLFSRIVKYSYTVRDLETFDLKRVEKTVDICAILDDIGYTTSDRDISMLYAACLCNVITDIKGGKVSGLSADIISRVDVLKKRAEKRGADYTSLKSLDENFKAFTTEFEKVTGIHIIFTKAQLRAIIADFTKSGKSDEKTVVDIISYKAFKRELYRALCMVINNRKATITRGKDTITEIA